MRVANAVLKFEIIRFRVREIHFPYFIIFDFLFSEHSRGYGLSDALGAGIFEIEENFAGVVGDFLSELVGVGGLVLVAENVENFGVVAGLDITIARIGLEMEAHILARRAVLNSKLPFHLPPSHPHPGNPENRQPKTFLHAEYVRTP